MAGTLRNALFISLIWHILCAGVIEPTFGKVLDDAHFPEVLFLGSILDSHDLAFLSQEEISDGQPKEPLYSRINLFNFKTSVLSKRKGESFLSLIKYRRPLFNLNYRKEEKIITRPRLDHSILDEYKKGSSLVFYPRLPYSFLIYFKDRQKAHIEFSFYISEKGVITFIDRKITSGNLEVDLLASRYINRHLNLIKGQFLTNTWQTVKIDLTRRDDQN
jgi:hypothetical protein